MINKNNSSEAHHLVIISIRLNAIHFLKFLFTFNLGVGVIIALFAYTLIIFMVYLIMFYYETFITLQIAIEFMCMKGALCM